MHASKHDDPADNATKLYHVLKVMTDRRRCKVPEGWLPSVLPSSTLLFLSLYAHLTFSSLLFYFDFDFLHSLTFEA